MRSLGTVPCLLAVIALALAAAPAKAVVPIYQTGFESPTFSLGATAGQDNWYAWGVDPVVIQNGEASGGTQALAIDRSNGPELWDGSGAGRYVNFDATNRVIGVGIDVFLTQSTSPSYWNVLNLWFDDDFFGINVEFDGAINIFTWGPVRHETGVYFQRGQWNRFEERLDFGTRTASVTYNGYEIFNGGIPGESSFIWDFQFSGQGPQNNDIGYFDNIMMAEVPEPSTLGLMGIGLGVLALGWRRRRR